MIKTEISNQALATIGEEIPHELGAKMVKDFQDAYPNESTSYLIGRDIIDQILNQPGCVAINFYFGLNELGKKTLVYAGVNNSQEIISEYSIINVEGKIESKQGIVADRVRDNTRGGSSSPSTSTSTIFSW